MKFSSYRKNRCQGKTHTAVEREKGKTVVACDAKWAKEGRLEEEEEKHNEATQTKSVIKKRKKKKIQRGSVNGGLSSCVLHSARVKCKHDHAIKCAKSVGNQTKEKTGTLASSNDSRTLIPALLTRKCTGPGRKGARLGRVPRRLQLVPVLSTVHTCVRVSVVHQSKDRALEWRRMSSSLLRSLRIQFVVLSA